MRAAAPCRLHAAGCRARRADPPSSHAPAGCPLPGRCPWVPARLGAAGHAVFTAGFGRGRPGAPAGLARFAEDVRAALVAILRPAVLVGHSLGALVVQRMLAEAPVLGAALLVPAWGLGEPCVVYGARRDRLVPPDTVVRTAAWHACPFTLLDDGGHLMMLDAGHAALADRLAGWLEETFR